MPCCWPETPIAATSTAGCTLVERLADGGLERREPPVRVLLAGAVLSGDEVVWGAAEGQGHEGLGVHQERLCGLGAAVDPEEGASRHRDDLH